MLLAGLLSLAIQWPHRPRFLFVWDSFLFANAAIEYDLLGGYPHPPGYPVFVFVVRIATLVTDPENALELVSMLFAALSSALFFGLAREFVARPPAALATLLFAFSPTLIYNGLMSVSYTAECAAAVGIAWLAVRTRARPSTSGCVAIAVALGIGAGLRTTVLLFLLPLVAWAVWGTREHHAGRLRRFLVAGVSGAGAVGAWLLPMFAFGGSLATWLATTRIQSDVVIFENTVFVHGFAAVRDQSSRVLLYLAPELSVILVAGIGLAASWRLRPTETSRAAAFLAIWILPSILFFCFIFSGYKDGPRGYALIFLPSIYLAVAFALDVIVGRLTQGSRTVSQRRAALLVAGLVVLAPLPSLEKQTDSLLQDDVYERNAWGTGWMGLRALPPNETAILASHEWEFARWYFPDYIVWGYLPGSTHPNWTAATWHFVLEARDRVDDHAMYGVYLAGVPPPEHKIPSSIRRVVLTDFAMAGENNGTRVLLPDVEVKEEILPNGWRILFFEVEPDRDTIEAYLLPLGRASG